MVSFLKHVLGILAVIIGGTAGLFMTLGLLMFILNGDFTKKNVVYFLILWISSVIVWSICNQIIVDFKL